jgi:hypothetical protein
MKLLRLFLLAFLVTACGGGGESTSQPQVVAPEVEQARLLASSAVTRRAGLFPISTNLINEPLVLAQQDVMLQEQFGPLVISGRFSKTLERLRTRAQIQSWKIAVLSDIACNGSSIGGGAAADSQIVLDGKQLDLEADIANGLALREAGKLSMSIPQIVDLAAAKQLSFAAFCKPTEPSAFPDAGLTTAEQDRAVEIFAQLAGGIVYHEFGHVWGWHSLNKIREQVLAPQNGLFRFSSATEDNADITAGILSAKAGHDQFFAQMAYDLMAFTYNYRRAPGSVSFVDTISWESQYNKSAANYSSLALRKTLVVLGYSAWRNK